MVVNIVNGNHEKVSNGGALVREMLSVGKYVLVNAMEKVQGGPFTRYEPNDFNCREKRSCLDLAIVSRDLSKFIDKVVIDDKLEFTPGYSNGKTMKYSDHFSLLIKFKGIPLRSGRVNINHEDARWNTRKTGGWDRYFSETNINKNLMKAVVDSEKEQKTTDQIDQQIVTELNKIKHRAFGKVKRTQKIKSSKELKNLHAKKEEALRGDDEVEMMKVNEEIVSTVKKLQREKLEKEISDLESLKQAKGNAAKIFRLKKEVVGGKKSEQEPTAIINPANNEIVTDPEHIKKLVLEYCTNVLTNRAPKPDFEVEMKAKRLLHEKRMKEHVENDLDELTLEMFNKSLIELMSKNGKKYEFITKGGNDLKHALFSLFKQVWRQENIPTRWTKSTLLQLFKGKGDFRAMTAMRSIHMKEDTAKVFGHIVVNVAKDRLMKNMSPFQIGTKKGHRASEHIFTMKSVMQLFALKNKPLIISFWDYKSFFDSESVIDVMGEVYNCNVKGKVYRLLYKMNQNTVIKVSTPVGTTGEASTGETVGQGTIEGAILSAVSIGGGVEEYFRDSPYELWYDTVRLQPGVFQDDLERMAGGRMEAQVGNQLMEIVAESKLLSFNLDKSAFMVVGTKKNKKEIETELEESPLTLCGQNMKRVGEYTYLGTVISEGGVGESVTASIKSKVGKVKQLIFEIKAVVEDCRNDTPGGFCTAIHIWEAAVIPYLYNAAECWLEVPREALTILNSLQETFMIAMLATPRTTPKVAMYWELAAPLAVNRIIEYKLRFYHHLVCLDKEAVAYKIYECQRKLNHGLVNECRTLLAQLNISECEVVNYTKSEWKKEISQKIKELNKNNILDQMKSYKKINFFEKKQEQFECKEYFKTMKLKDSRMLFSLNSKMTKTVKSHFFGDKKFASELWSCQMCQKIDTILHIKICPSYSHLRENKDLNNDFHLAEYFNQVLQIRQSLVE